MLLLLDIAEIAISKIPIDATTIFYPARKLYEELIKRYPFYSKRINFYYFKFLLKKVFPIYKNPRKNTKRFKITIIAAKHSLSEYGLTLKPIEHIRRKIKNDKF